MLPYVTASHLLWNIFPKEKRPAISAVFEIELLYRQVVISRFFLPFSSIFSQKTNQELPYLEHALPKYWSENF